MSADRFAGEFLAVDGLAKDGLVERSGSRIVVPESARAFVRTVCSVFDQYLAPDETRFSRAS
jgi:coproporphyrinogen III oxidase-like Fe-S oxidoreductase